MSRRVVVFGWVIVGLLGLPGSGAAQSIGVGPRFSFVQADLGLETPATTFFGATGRYRVTRHVSLELAGDYRKYRGRLARFREVPVQASALVAFPPSLPHVKPYVVGGAGMYSRAIDIFDANGLLFATTTERKSGWHLGAGAEVPIHRRAAAFADVRFRSVQFGEFPDGSILSGLADLKLSRGPMVTSGVAFYF
jgi:opacity protein-like surface antigen